MRTDCAQLCARNSISLHDFYFLNTMIDANCTNLWTSK